MSTLAQHAFDCLKERLLAGKIQPGDVLSERQIAHDLGMSKTPVRSAIARLASEGFVTISPQRGIVVCAMGLREVADCFELRLVLEPYILRQIAGRLTSEQIDGLYEQLAALEACAQERDFARSALHDLELHLAFARALGNGEILRVMTHLRDRIRLSINAVHEHDPSRLTVGHAEHRAIVDALIDGDGDRAAEQMAAHLDRGKRALYPRNL